jgi:hypothetical protein
MSGLSRLYSMQQRALFSNIFNLGNVLRVSKIDVWLMHIN